MSLKFALLGLLTYQPMTGYDLKTIFDESINHFWSASASQIYRDLGTLENEGFVTSHIEPQEGRPDKKVYTVTGLGEKAFMAWVNHFPPQLQCAMRYEFLVRIFFGSRIDPQDLIFQLQKFIREQQEDLRHIKTAEEELGQSEEYPEIEKFYWGLTASMGKKASLAAIEWAEESIREIQEFTAKQPESTGLGKN